MKENELTPDRKVEEIKDQKAEEIRLVQFDEGTIKNVMEHLGAEKGEALSSMQKRYFIDEELAYRLRKLQFTQEEIEAVFLYTKALEEEEFSRRYGMTPELYKKWLYSLEYYKDNPEENPYYYIHPPLQVLEDEKFSEFY